MKRSSFFKILGGIALAPLAASGLMSEQSVQEGTLVINPTNIRPKTFESIEINGLYTREALLADFRLQEQMDKEIFLYFSTKRHNHL